LFVEHLRTKNKAATTLHLIHHAPHLLFTSAIVAAELFYGDRTPAQRSDVEQLLENVKVFPFTLEDAKRISHEVERLKRRNALIAFRDLAIACVALEQGLPVATFNRRESERVEGLELLPIGPN